MEQVSIKLDGKEKTYIVTGNWPRPNGIVLKGLWKRGWKGGKFYFASFNSQGEYIDGTFTCHGINHASDLLDFVLKHI